MLPSPEARPHGLLKSNRSRSAAGSIGESVVTFAATDLGAPALGAGIVSRAAWFDVTLRSRLRLYCPAPLRAKITKLLNEALPFHSIKKGPRGNGPFARGLLTLLNCRSRKTGNTQGVWGFPRSRWVRER